MRVEKCDTDFYVYLSGDDIKKVCRRISRQEDTLRAGQYHSIVAEIEYKPQKHDLNVLETLTLTPTRDISVLNSEYARNDIYFRCINVYECDICKRRFSSDEWSNICPFDNTKMKIIEKGIDVKVYLPLLGKLLEGKLDHIGTRYNMQDKILIFYDRYQHQLEKKMHSIG
ncbi:MAG: hypothetical protein J7J15_00365 [Candidatus Aenigmarchaeota archaeon]|nr:hypothetical protein [Candidatus Aenigmarchaeota archaeon]